MATAATLAVLLTTAGASGPPPARGEGYPVAGRSAPAHRDEGPAGPPARLADGRLAAPPRLAGPVVSSACPVPPYGPQYAAPGRGRTVALTFDDGPGASTPQIIDILRRYGVPATFMNIGENEAARPGLVVEEVRDGYAVGSHTWDHPDMAGLSPSRQAAELDRTSAEQRALTGTVPCLFRPPYGDYDATTLQLARQRRLAVWMWSVDTEDWKADGSGSSFWVDRIVRLAESEGGALDHPVVLMHNQPAGNPATVEALPTIIRYFRDRGYRFVDLLGRTSPATPCLQATAGARPRATLLGSGRRLRSGQSLTSPGGQYHLVMQRDGNLVEYTAGGRVLWASGTAGHPGAWVVMQADGNLVVYAGDGRALWSTGTDDHHGAHLAVQADARLVIYTSGGAGLWSRSSNHELGPGERLEPGWYLSSPDAACRLVMQSDGNLVLYDSGGAVWATATGGHPGAWAVMQGDGNLVVYSPTRRALWASRTGQPGATLQVDDDRRVEVVGSGRSVLWSAGG